MNSHNIYYTTIPENIELEYLITTKSIPDDIIGEIISFLPQNDVNNCSLVNKQWNFLSKFHSNWELFFNKSFPNTGLQVTKNEWRQLYIKESYKLKDSAPQLFFEKIEQIVPSSSHFNTGLPSTLPKLRNRFCIYGMFLCMGPLAAVIFVSFLVFDQVVRCGGTLNKSTNSTMFNETRTHNSTNSFSICEPVNAALAYGPGLALMVLVNICTISCFLFKIYKAYTLEDHSSERSCEQLGRLSKEYVKDKCQSVVCNIL